MKKVHLANPLDLGKEIIASLNEQQLQEIEGGAGADEAASSCSSGGNSCVVIKTNVESEVGEG